MKCRITYKYLHSRGMEEGKNGGIKSIKQKRQHFVKETTVNEELKHFLKGGVKIMWHDIASSFEAQSMQRMQVNDLLYYLYCCTLYRTVRYILCYIHAEINSGQHLQRHISALKWR